MGLELARESPAPLRYADDSPYRTDRGHGKVLPMSSDVSVTYLPGCSRRFVGKHVFQYAIHTTY